MHNMIRKYNLSPGDCVVVPKSNFRIIDHYALYLGYNEYGVDLFAENHYVFGVRVITADDFFNDAIEVSRIKRFKGDNYQRKIAVQKALKKAGKPYSLITYNCEHFANEIQNGKAYSNQVAWGVGILAGLALLLFAFKGKK